MDYYKAVRVAGTSFYDSRTEWAVGKRVTIPKAKRQTELCGPGILHVSDAPAETLLGGSWPCRLFRVEPGKIVASDGHKHGTHSVRVLEELPAWQALGPNGEAVAALIERCKTLTGEEAKRLYAAGYAAGYAAWGAARDAAGYAARYAARVAARDAARYAAWYAAWYAARVAARYAARYAARVAARDAALALVTWEMTGETYTVEQRDLLIAPWKEVVGLPEGLE